YVTRLERVRTRRLSAVQEKVFGLNGLAHLAGQVAHELNSDAARSGPAGLGPFDGAGGEGVVVDLETVSLAVAVDHAEVGRLVAIVKAQPQAEAVGQRDLLFDRLAGVD